MSARENNFVLDLGCETLRIEFRTIPQPHVAPPLTDTGQFVEDQMGAALLERLRLVLSEEVYIRFVFGLH